MPVIARNRLRRRWLYASLATVALVGMIGLMALRGGETRPTADDQVDRAHSRVPAVGVADSVQPNGEATVPLTRVAELTPAEVMGNPDCTMTPGTRLGGGMALVVVRGGETSRFAVVDGSGVVFGDTVPFGAILDSSFARRSDGSVVVGFGRFDAELRLDSPFRGSAELATGDALKGAVVYQDGQVIYENGEATRFGLADDGSSFYVVEPLAGGVSRLAIRNLDLGRESHYELDALPIPSEEDLDQLFVRYSVDRSEVVVQPFVFPGEDRFPVPVGFFPTGGGKSRHLVEVHGLPMFASSREGYSLTHRGGDSATVKHEYRYADGEVLAEVRWTRELRMGPVSDDGLWLVGASETAVHVVDTATGDTVFEHSWSPPVDHNYTTLVQDGRFVLGHRIADPADIARCLGLRGKREVVRRAQGDSPDGTVRQRVNVDTTDEKACLADLRERGLYRLVYDVYDLRTLADGTPPDHYRVEYGENPHCGSSDDPFGMLEVRDDELVYIPRA